MATTSFFIRKTKDKATIWFRFSFKRGVSPFRKSTGEQIPSNAWDSKRQKVKDLTTTSAFAPKINERLSKITKHFEENTKGEIINSALLEKLWLNLDDKKGIDFAEWIDTFIEDCRERINPKTKRKYSIETIKKYKQSQRILKEFSQDKYYVNFKDLNNDFHQSLLRYLEVKGLSQNTIGGYVKNIKVFAKEAAKNHPVHEFILSEDFYLPSEDTHSIFVNQEEIQKVFDYEFESERLLNARNWFIIGCWTGLRISDWGRVKDFNSDFITIRPEKTKNTTGKSVVIPVHPQIKAIIDKYGMPYKIADQNFNEYIKEVFFKAGITAKVFGAKMESVGEDEKGRSIMRKSLKKFPKNELVSSHTCRRSFATNNYLMGIDTLTIMQITGHTTEKSFLKYIKVTPTQHAERLKQKWEEYYSRDPG